MHLYCRLLLLSLLGACSIVATAAFGWLHLDIRSVVTHSIFFPKSNIHRDDVDLAFSLANQSGSAPSHILGDGSNVLAFLFMIKDHIVHEEYWRLFFQSMADDSFQIYIHATAPSSEVSIDLGQNVVQIGRTASAWCELMAVEMALFKTAFEDESNGFFILLSYDALPLVHPHVLRQSLIPGQSSMCPAGSPAVDVPWSCNYYGSGNIFLHPRLLVKHHQWAIFARRHVKMLVNSQAVAAARETFLKQYVGMPVCSDEVLPMLTLLAYHEMSFSDWRSVEALGVHQQCPVFAFWNGCYHDNEVPTLSSLLEPEGEVVRWMFARKSYRLTEAEDTTLRDRLAESGYTWKALPRTTSPAWRPDWRYPLLSFSYWLKSNAFLFFIVVVGLDVLLYIKVREFCKDDLRKLSPTYIRQLAIFGAAALTIIAYIVLLEIFLVDAARHSF